MGKGFVERLATMFLCTFKTKPIFSQIRFCAWIDREITGLISLKETVTPDFRERCCL